MGAHRDLGGAYDDAIAAGLVERIGAEVDRRVDERISRYQRVGQSAADGAGSPDARHRPAAHPGSPVSWQQTVSVPSAPTGPAAAFRTEGRRGRLQERAEVDGWRD